MYVYVCPVREAIRGTVKVSIATAATEEDTRFDTVKKELVYSSCREITAVASIYYKGNVQTYRAV